MAQDTKIKWLSSESGSGFALGKGRTETFIATTAIAAGDVVSFDTSEADWQNVVPRAAATRHLLGNADSIPLGVALHAADAGARCEVALSGVVTCQVEGTVDIAIGSALIPRQATAFDMLVAQPELIIDDEVDIAPPMPVFAWALEAFTTNGVGLIKVLLRPQF
jgi:predicted RecA/RadA family phage recombinase